ncbi:MAG: 2Fe-2S iron-sulfur cluster binding domain-containing protein, partial [Candidatus Heimdallarchaeota archaeon]
MQKGYTILTLEITNFNQEVQIIPNETDLLSCIHEKLDKSVINSLCGGTGKCGRCRVLVNHQMPPQCLNPPTGIEKQLLKESLHQNTRLACQIIPRGNGNLSITILELSEDQDSMFKIQDTYKNFKL